jgi:hypothetical protein
MFGRPDLVRDPVGFGSSPGAKSTRCSPDLHDTFGAKFATTNAGPLTAKGTAALFRCELQRILGDLGQRVRCRGANILHRWAAIVYKPWRRVVVAKSSVDHRHQVR